MSSYILIKEYPDGKWAEIIEKPVEKDYEILSISLRRPNKHQIRNVDAFDSDEYIISLINCDGNGIHSIKRLSDGEVFTIGNKVVHANNVMTREATVQSFRIMSNDIWFKTDVYDVPMCLISGKANPLFTTEDQIDIFEGDKVFIPQYMMGKLTGKYIDFKVMRPEQFLDVMSFSTKEAAQQYIDSKRIKVEDGYLYEDESTFSVLTKNSWQFANYRFKSIQHYEVSIHQLCKEWLHFTTEEARSKYIEDNKPMYSKKDMLDFATDVKHGTHGVFTTRTILDNFNNWIKK